MQQTFFQRLPGHRFVLAVLAGLCMAASFPNLGVAGLAWIAPGLMLACALGKRGGEAFRIGYVGGLAHYLAMLYWLLNIPFRWHGIPFGPAAGWLALSGFMALYPATWVWLMSGPVSPWHVSNTGQSVSGGWARSAAWSLGGAAAWVAMEMCIARFLGGFPWDLLGVSQYRMLPLIQIASVTGVYGVSFLLVWFSLSLVSAFVSVLKHPGESVPVASPGAAFSVSRWVPEMVLPLLAVAVCFAFGWHQCNRELPPGRPIRITLVQPSIPQLLIWDSDQDEERFQALLRLTEQALTNKTDLLIWPESAVPKPLRYYEDTFEAITGLAKRHKVWVILGSDDNEPRPGALTPRDRFFYNSSFLVSPEGKLMERYVKRNLVIFGEYVPLEHWLPFLKYFTPIQGGFTPGTGPVQFVLDSLDVKTAVLICFEDIFPQLARSDVAPDTDFLVNLTNDGWFGESAAQWQQAVSASFRAVENRVPLVRCSNNGLTCWFDAYGRMRQVFRDERGTVYGTGFMNFELPVLEKGAAREPSFYNRHGDWFGWGCVLLTILLLCHRTWRSRKHPQRTSLASGR